MSYKHHKILVVPAFPIQMACKIKSIEIKLKPSHTLLGWKGMTSADHM
jgi:hypothetical protein